MSLVQTLSGSSWMKWNALRRSFGRIFGVGALFLFLPFVACASEGGGWRESKSEHFEVFYNKAPDYFVKSVIREAEAIYRRTTYSLGFTRSKGWIAGDQVRIYIFDGSKEYSRASGLPWSGASVSVAQRTIKTFPSANGFFDSTLPHELGHIVFRDFVGFNADIPLWLDEGVAVYQEQSGRLGADQAVRAALKSGKFIPLGDLGQTRIDRSFPNGRIKLAYAESASVVAYLIDHGETYRFVRFCRELKDGRRFDWALNKAYMKFKNISDLEQAWKDAVLNGSDR